MREVGQQVGGLIFKISQVEYFLVITRATIGWSKWEAVQESPRDRLAYLMGYLPKHWSHLE